MREVIANKDTNKDGRIDFESHEFPGGADGDWSLEDEDYDGIYDKRTISGVGVLFERVSIPVAVAR